MAVEFDDEFGEDYDEGLIGTIIPVKIEHPRVGEPARSFSGGWSQSGTLVTGSSDNSVSLQANFPESFSYTIQVTIDGLITQSVTEPNPISPLVTVEWTVEGNIIRRQFIGPGSLTGVGQACKVFVQDATPNLGDKQNGIIYGISISISKGVRGNSVNPPQYPQYPTNKIPMFVVAAATTSPPIPVPPNAGVISVYVTVAAVPPAPIPEEGVLVNHLNVASQIIKQYDPRQTQEWVPMAPGTTAISLSNTTVAQTLQFSVTWGIEG